MKYLFFLLFLVVSFPSHAQDLSDSILKEQVAARYRQQARQYAKAKNYDSAISSYHQVIRYAPAHGNRELLMLSLKQLGLLYEFKGNYPEAFKYYRQSFEISDSLSFAKKALENTSETYSHDFMNNVMGSLKQKTENIGSILETIAKKESLNDTLALSINYFNLGLLYKNKKMYPQSRDALQTSLQYATKIHYGDMQGSAANELADLYSLMGNPKMSLFYLKKNMLFHAGGNKDSKTVDELQTKYEIIQREDQILEQKFEITKRNYWMTGIAVFIVLMLLIGIIYYKQARLQQRNIAMQAIIQTEESERRRIAQDLHDSVSQTMSAAKINLTVIGNELPFKSAEQKQQFEKTISLVDYGFREVRTISHNMMPWALHKTGLAQVARQFISNIENKTIDIQFFSRGLDEPFNDTIEIILYRVLQESVNNVMKHAAASRLDISLIRDEERISMTVEDNGKGFDAADPKFTKGMGLHNLQSRINFLNGKVEFDSSPGKGTLVSIYIPLTHKKL